MKPIIFGYLRSASSTYLHHWSGSVDLPQCQTIRLCSVSDGLDVEDALELDDHDLLLPLVFLTRSGLVVLTQVHGLSSSAADFLGVVDVILLGHVRRKQY